MGRLRIPLIALFLATLASFAKTGNAPAQDSPGYGMRMPIGGTGSLGGSVRPPPLTGKPNPPSNPGRFPGNGRWRPYYGYYWPYVYDSYYDSSEDYMAPEDSTADPYTPETQRVPVLPPRDVFTVYDTVTAVGLLQVTSVVVGSKPMLRLSWPDQGSGAKQVAFFLADSAKKILAAQTIRAAPFMALFEPAPGTAYAGMTVMLSGGTLDTQYVPYKMKAVKR